MRLSHDQYLPPKRSRQTSWCKWRKIITYCRSWQIFSSRTTNQSSHVAGVLGPTYSSCLMINIKHLGRLGRSNQVRTDIPPQKLQVKWVSVSGFTFAFQFVVVAVGSPFYPVKMCINTGNSGKGFYLYQKYFIEWFIMFITSQFIILCIFTGYSSDVVSKISSTDLDLGVESLEQMIELITVNTFYNKIPRQI